MSNRFIIARGVRFVVEKDGILVERDLNQTQTEHLAKIPWAQFDKLAEWRKEVAP